MSSIWNPPTFIDYEYNKACEDCHPCKSATCHSWPCFYRTGKFLRHYWALVHNLVTCFSWILATASHLVLWFLYKFNHHILGNLQCFIILYLTVCKPKSSFVSRTTSCPLNLRSFFVSTQHTAIFWWQLITVLKSLFFDRSTYLLSSSITCLCTLNCTFAQVVLHNYIFIMSGVFHTLATLTAYMIWTVLNGNKLATIDGFLCNLLHWKRDTNP